MLYFIKGDSQKNWAAMKLKLSKGASLPAVINGMEKDGWKCVTFAAYNAWRKQHAAQQNAHPTLGDSATSQAESNAETLSTSDGVPPSAPARVA